MNEETIESGFEMETYKQGMVGSAFSFFVQAWCISRRGPLFAAMFNPLGTVITTVFAAVLIHEEIYTGRYPYRNLSNDESLLTISFNLIEGDAPNSNRDYSETVFVFLLIQHARCCWSDCWNICCVMG